MRQCRLQGRGPDDDDDGHEQPACDRAVEEQEEERGAKEEEAAGSSLAFNRHQAALCKQSGLRPKCGKSCV